MKIGIQTWGSNGDIRPMIALANGLQQAGHTVTLVASSIDNHSYKDQCALYNIAYRQIPETIAFDMEDFAQRTFRMNSAQWLLALLDAVFFPYEDILYQASQQLAAENDLVIGHHFLYPLKIAAMKQNKPFYSVTFCHGIIPCRSEPPLGFPQLGQLLNPLQWKAMDIAFNFILKKKLTTLWLAEGLPSLKSVMFELLSSESLNLVAVDPALCQAHQEWPSRHQACGFLNLPSNIETWPIPDDLQKFLDAGPAPVYLTFGSLQQAVPEWSMGLFIEACRLAGCRAVIQTSSKHFPENTQQGDIYFIGKHPHQQLFPQCAAIVHHGGAGTTHSASLCGRPSIVIPFMDEQLFWARSLQKLGIAPKPLPAKHATAALLASRITTVLTNHNFIANAELIGGKISRTQGVENAIRLIEQASEISEK